MISSILDKFVVRVNCMTFNHKNYIEDAMNGFCMQQTNFPFICVIVDDASTDGEQEVIRNYLHEHFDLEDDSVVRNEETEDYIYSYARHKTNHNCYFAVYYLKYNHHSIKKPKAEHVKEWKQPVNYIAICEGDDYWIDPLKLQKQVDFMESHPDCTMTCSRAKLYSERQHKYIGERYCYNNSQFVDPKEIIERSGLFINTCSILYKREVKDNYPDYCKKSAAGDYPLQIMAAMKGKVYYFNETMSVYRVENSNSWMGRLDYFKDADKRIRIIKSEVDMFKGFAKDYPSFSQIFQNRIDSYIYGCFPSGREPMKIKKEYMYFFKEDISKFGMKWRTLLYMIYLVPGLSTLLFPIVMKKYNVHNHYYE